MIKSKEEYYSILERLRTLNFNQKLSKNLQAKLEAFEEMEELVNLTIPDVSKRTFRFSGLYNKDKFVKYIIAPNRETAIAYFETENPHLTWRTTTELD